MASTLKVVAPSGSAGEGGGGVGGVGQPDDVTIWSACLGESELAPET